MAPEAGNDDEPRRRASDHGRYGRLSRERVLAAALEVVDRDGLSSLSMRRLGAELDVEAMALYRYAASKDDLLEGLVEAFFDEVNHALDAGDGGDTDEGADGDASDWRPELHRIARTTYRVALSHPQVVPLLATRMLNVPLARRPVAVLRNDERVLRLLRDAGFDDARTVSAHRAITAWLLGYLLSDLRAMVDDSDEPDPAFRLGLHRLSAQLLPLLRATAPALAERGGPEELASGLDALLASFIA